MKNLFGERFDMIGIHKGVFQLQPKPMSCLGAGTGHGSSSTGRNTYIDYELEDEKSNGHHDGGTAFEELKNFPESEVDDMRHQKDIQLQLYMQEMALKEQLIHKMNAPSSNAKNSSTSKSIEENESKSDRENHRSRK